MGRLQTYSAPGIMVTYDPGLCTHSAVCLASLPAVFDVRRKRWIRPEAASPGEVAAAVDRCPSGALRHRREGEGEGIEEAEGTGADERSGPDATIRLSDNGPLLVEGSFTILDENGAPLPIAGRAALCRCGGTRNPPFCDGSHRTVGFRSRR